MVLYGPTIMPKRNTCIDINPSKSERKNLENADASCNWYKVWPVAEQFTDEHSVDFCTTSLHW
jgi:hypothetical protein